MVFERNVGGMDRMIRIGTGIVLVGVAMFAEMSVPWRTVAWVVAAAAFITAFVGFCPINKTLSIDTSGDS